MHRETDTLSSKENFFQICINLMQTVHFVFSNVLKFALFCKTVAIFNENSEERFSDDVGQKPLISAIFSHFWATLGAEI